MRQADRSLPDQVHSGKSERYYTESGRSRFNGGCELYIRCGQARRVESWNRQRGTLSRPAVGSQRGPVRLAKVCLDWQLDADQRDALNDPDLIGDARKKGLEPELISGEELQVLAKEVIVQPSEVIARIQILIGD